MFYFHTPQPLRECLRIEQKPGPSEHVEIAVEPGFVVKNYRLIAEGQQQGGAETVSLGGGLRRHLGGKGDTFPQYLKELRSYFQADGPGNGVHAVPGEGLDVPIWLLGSIDFSARLAARLGLPFAFTSHLTPDFLHRAVALYRHYFEPSEVLDHPHVMIGDSAVAADSDAEARRLFTTVQQ